MVNCSVKTSCHVFKTFWILHLGCASIVLSSTDSCALLWCLFTKQLFVYMHQKWSKNKITTTAGTCCHLNIAASTYRVSLKKIERLRKSLILVQKSIIMWFHFADCSAGQNPGADCFSHSWDLWIHYIRYKSKNTEHSRERWPGFKSIRLLWKNRRHVQWNEMAKETER